MTDALEPDLCVIGAGPAAFAVAAAALAVGARVVVVDRDPEAEARARTGEWAAAALGALAARDTPRTKNDPGRESDCRSSRPALELAPVHTALDPITSGARLGALNATVLTGRFRFLSRNAGEVQGQRIAARRYVLAPASEPVRPALPGLDLVRPLTRDSLPTLKRLPDRLVVLGGGAEALEVAQSFARLGTKVTLVRAGDAAAEVAGIDDDLLAIALAAVEADGVEIRREGRAVAVEPDAAGLSLVLSEGLPVSADALYLACGRKPLISDLGLEAARVRLGSDGLVLGRNLRTTNRRIYAVGEAVGGPSAAHSAAQQASIVVRSALFRLPARLDPELHVRTLRTVPPIAACGRDERAAQSRRGPFRVHRAAFASNEAAVVAGDARGHVKVLADKNGRILGAGIAGRNAEELIALWQIAMSKGIRIQEMASLVTARFSLTETSRQAAVAAMMSRLRSPWVSRGLRLARWLG